MGQLEWGTRCSTSRGAEGKDNGEGGTGPIWGFPAVARCALSLHHHTVHVLLLDRAAPGAGVASPAAASHHGSRLSA